jgi:hypothetical protein
VIHDLAARLTEVLSGQPAPVLPSASIAPRRPGASGDLPAVAMSITVDRAEQAGFARLVRGSEQLPDGTRTRDDTRGDRIAGTVAFEVWAGQATGAANVARALETKLRSQEAALRERGFSMLRPAALDAMESLRHEPGVTSAFNAWRQRLAYRFVFDLLEGGELVDGGVIERVDVDVVDPPQESFSTPSTPS